MYNIAILGAGPAGYTAAAAAQKGGLSVILFEKNALGGVCLNEGCIPTKTLLYSAKQYHNALTAAKYGINATAVTYDWLKLQQRKQKVVRKLVAGIRQQLQGVEVVTAEAKVISRTDDCITIQAADQTYEAQKLLICTGSTNFTPPISGITDNPAVWTSTDALNAKELPASIIIIGGGVIGLEFATIYNELGIPVTIVEAMPRLLPNLDPDCVKLLTDNYQKKGIQILTNTKVESINGNTILTNNGSFTADRILISVGRRANLNGLEALNDLELERGAIKVGDFMQTNLKNVYAAGDVTGKLMLAHVASRQAEVAIGRILKQLPLQRIAYNAIPSVVYTNPEIAAVGLTTEQLADFYRDMEGEEQFLKKGGVEYFVETRTLPMTYSGRFVAENEGETGLCKLVIDKRNQTIMGVHLVGNTSSEFISAASIAVRFGYTTHELKQVIFPHPTTSEILKIALE